jgi:transcriptional regulator with XRE-family HTH domain
MSRTEATSICDLLRHRVRRLRDERGETRDELARRARRFGLPWTQAAVAHIEDGTRAIPVEEFLLLPFVFGCELADLFATENDPAVLDLSAPMIELTEQARATGSAVAAVLRGEWARQRPGDFFDTPETRDPRHVVGIVVEGIARHVERRMKTYKRLWPGATLEELIEAESAADSLAESKAAAKLGTDAKYVTVAAFGLWRRSLTEERDRRLSDRVADDISARSRQAARGHITRELLSELEPAIRRHVKRGKR